MSEKKPFKKVVSRSTFGKNLAKALKKRESGTGGAGADAAGADSAQRAALRGDSFTERLTKHIKASEPSAPVDAAAPIPLEPGAEQPQPAPAQPVGTGERVVKEGECIASIAIDTGHFCDTIWLDGNNTELRGARKDPYVLLPGDRVHIPPLREKWEGGKQTEMRHRFRRKGWPEVLRFRVLSDGKPRGNESYAIDVDGSMHTGTTDPEGNLACPIMPNAKRAVLRVGSDDNVTVREFLLGGIDPIESISGIQGRLNNLGFDCGPVDGICGPRTQAALGDYQRRRLLEITGMPDDATRKQLQSDYGC